ncbi:hypothetical protein D3C74_445240 [compost metagenome]
MQSGFGQPRYWFLSGTGQGSIGVVSGRTEEIAAAIGYPRGIGPVKLAIERCI